MVSPNPVVQGMTNLERRRTPRTTITGHAYVNIEPNNGGIVLNVSDEGLCFHSFDPVPRNGKVRFWFSERNRRIEAQAKLAWTDETQKAGLQFTTLPAEAREQIRQWMIQSATPLGTVDGSVAQLFQFTPHREAGAFLGQQHKSESFHNTTAYQPTIPATIN